MDTTSEMSFWDRLCLHACYHDWNPVGWILRVDWQVQQIAKFGWPYPGWKAPVPRAEKDHSAKQNEPYVRLVVGFTVMVDDAIGHIAVQHEGRISWDELWWIKNVVWGDEARAIEVYPRRSELVNTKEMRHLWRLGDTDFCPDLLGRHLEADTLEARWRRAWENADEVFG